MIRHGFIAEDLPSPRLWTTGEERALRELYPTGGATACRLLLAKRSRTAIKQRAHVLGVTWERSTSNDRRKSS